MILFFDTETTGLPMFKAPKDDPAQARMVQLACLLTEDDGTELSSLSLLVDPQKPISAEALETHGITDDKAMRAGIPHARAASLWSILASSASLVVAHNIAFDWFVMRVAFALANADFLAKHDNRPTFCTMRRAAPIVNLPPTPRMVAAGFTAPKSPKLEECVRHFFGEEMDGAHDAMVDVRACARVFFHLRSLGVSI